MSTIDLTDTIDTYELAQVLQVPQKRIFVLIARGELEAVKRGGRYFIPRTAIHKISMAVLDETGKRHRKGLTRTRIDPTCYQWPDGGGDAA